MAHGLAQIVIKGVIKGDDEITRAGVSVESEPGGSDKPLITHCSD